MDEHLRLWDPTCNSFTVWFYRAIIGFHLNCVSLFLYVAFVKIVYIDIKKNLVAYGKKNKQKKRVTVPLLFFLACF